MQRLDGSVLVQWVVQHRSPLILGLALLVVYVGLALWLVPSYGVIWMVLSLPVLAYWSWSFGLWGGLAAGVLSVPLQLTLFQLSCIQCASHTEALTLVLVTGLAVCFGVGSLRSQTDRRLEAQAAVYSGHLEAERRAAELALLTRVRDRLARDLEPEALMLAAVDAVQELGRYESVACYQVQSGELNLMWVGGKQTLPDSFGPEDALVSQALQGHSVFISQTDHGHALLYGRSLVAVPIMSRGRVEGVLAIAGSYIEGRDVQVIEEVAAQLGMALERTQVYARLREQEALYRVLLETMPDGIAVSDGHSLLYVNSSVLTHLGFANPEQMLGQPLQSFVHPDSLPRLHTRMQHVLSGGQDQLEEVKVVGPDGRVFEVEAKGVLVQLGEQTQVLISARDISQRKEQQRHIEFLAYHDPLTGLPNRTKLWEIAQSWLSSDRRKRQSPALIYLDIDNFKMLNDTLDHQAGDELLRQVAERIKGELRQEDALARLGGDEFAVLLSNAERQDALTTAQRILQVFANAFVLGNHSLHVQASLGVALYPDHGSSLDELARAADVAMYQAKSDRSRICVYDPNQDRNSLERLELIQELRRTIQGGGFLIQYQPILDIFERSIQKWEALVRWVHPTRGLLRPSEFIPLAEEAGLIGDLDLAVLRQALRDHHLLGGEITINFSAATLSHPNWVREVIRAVVDADMPPSKLWLEITESALLPERQKWLSGLVALRGLGIRVALDDFGTGYSSISHLRQVPIDLVKIDKLFVQEIGENPASEDILRALIGLTEAFGLKALAEGVENRQQLEWLAKEGCHFAQGYYVGLPMPPEQAVDESLTRVF